MKYMLNMLLVFLIACAPHYKWLSYTDIKHGYIINYPDNWVKKNNSSTIIFVSPKKNEKDAFQENVNIMLQDLSQQTMTLDQYTSLTQKQVIDNLGVSSIVSLKDIKIAGQQAKEFVYKMNYQGVNLKLKQCFFVKEKTAYLFTYTAEISEYDQYITIAAEMVDSFSLGW